VSLWLPRRFRAPDKFVTTTNPEARGRLCYAAFCGKLRAIEPPPWDDLPDAEREAWTDAARVLWELATTGETRMDVHA
jgi:hypothetical protein